MSENNDLQTGSKPVGTKVFVLYTGGTIGMAPKEAGKPRSPLEPKPLNELLKYVPTLSHTCIELGYGSFEKPLDSSDLGPHHWIEMAERIEAVYDQYDGFVILHGTDTLAYTASALAFMFENLSKPVVITGSQLPISDARTDAVMNLVNAIFVAGWKITGIPCIPEVVVVFADRVLRGCRTRKVSSTSWAAFHSPNFPALGRIGEQIEIVEEFLRPMPAPGQSFRVSTELANRVIDITLIPGFRPSHLRQMLVDLDGVDAVVLRTFGAGNAPGTPEFLNIIHEVIHQHGKTVLNVTQCMEGMVEMGLYQASSALLERGVISGLDMTPEAALTKLMWTLGTKTDEQVVTQMQVSQRGEQSENLFDLRYGPCGTQDEPQQKFVKSCIPDRRFDLAQLSRMTVRFSGLGFDQTLSGETVRLRVFLNLPDADAMTPMEHARCVACLSLLWDGHLLNPTQFIENAKARTAIGDGDVTLTVIAEAGIRFWFEGLFVALFTKA